MRNELKLLLATRELNRNTKKLKERVIRLKHIVKELPITGNPVIHRKPLF